MNQTELLLWNSVPHFLCAMHVYGQYDSLCQRSMGLVPELSVGPPVGHVCPDWVPPLLPQNLLYQLSAGHVHHNQGAVLRFPQSAVDPAVLDL